MSEAVNTGNVMREVFDRPSKALRVNITGSGSITLPNVMRITDGTGFISSTTSGAKRALDVNMINGIELTISHLDDSIRIGDGTGLVTATDYGSKKLLDVSLANITTTTEGVKKLLDVHVANSSVAGAPYVVNIPMPLANTEYNYPLLANTKQIMFKSRNNSLLKFTFAAGQSGTTFITVPEGSTYTLEGIDQTTSITLYFQSPNVSETLEIISWV